MAKYLLIYKSPAGFDTTQLPKEQIAKAMQAWGEWLGAMGPSVVDKGDMLKKAAKSVGANGVQMGDDSTSGYSIIEFENYDKALEAAAGSPIIHSGGRVEVYEAFGL